MTKSLKIPVSPYAKGMIILDDQVWFTEEAMTRSGLIRVGKNGLYPLYKDGRLDTMKLFGVRYYQTNGRTPFSKLGSLNSKYSLAMDSMTTGNFLEVLVTESSMKSVNLESWGIEGRFQWVFGRVTGGFMGVDGRWYSCSSLVEEKSRTWYTMEEYLKKRSLAWSSRTVAYKDVAEGKAFAIDFMGKKNALFTIIKTK